LGGERHAPTATAWAEDGEFMAAYYAYQNHSRGAVFLTSPRLKPKVPNAMLPKFRWDMGESKDRREYECKITP
jgi:hypothetical protein